MFILFICDIIRFFLFILCQIHFLILTLNNVSFLGILIVGRDRYWYLILNFDFIFKLDNLSCKLDVLNIRAISLLLCVLEFQVS